MLKFELEKLIGSLSAAEKKLFKQHCARQRETKDYIILFELFTDQVATSSHTAESLFTKRFPGRSFENSAAYLWRVLSNILLQTRVDQDKWYLRYQALMKARLCFERSLPHMALKELKKAQKLAVEAEDPYVHYQALRMELNYLTDIGLSDVQEQALVDQQMQGRNLLRVMQQIHEHQSLHQLLTQRLNHDDALVFRDQKKITDLVLSELSITNRGMRHQFETKKLHLLFQSFFFIRTSEYHAALKIFKELITLIEAHENMWNFPPYDYLSALRGILDSLRTIGYYIEMDYFIDRVDKLSQAAYPEHFIHEAKQTYHVYRLNMLSQLRKDKEALQLVQSLKKQQLLKNNFYYREEHNALLFFTALVYFQQRKWSDANHYLQLALSESEASIRQPIYRSIRLLHLLVHTELDNMEYLQYEVRAYKRSFSKGGMFQIEKFIFKLIQLDPKRCSPPKKRAVAGKWHTLLENLRLDKQELQLLKYADFIGWVKEKID